MLHCAAGHGAVAIVEVLLGDDTDLPNDSYVNTADDDGRIPIHWAAWKCKPDVVKVLIERGSRLDVKTKSGFTPLHYCATGSSKEEALQCAASFECGCRFSRPKRKRSDSSCIGSCSTERGLCQAPASA